MRQTVAPPSAVPVKPASPIAKPVAPVASAAPANAGSPKTCAALHYTPNCGPSALRGDCSAETAGGKRNPGATSAREHETFRATDRRPGRSPRRSRGCIARDRDWRICGRTGDENGAARATSSSSSGAPCTGCGCGYAPSSSPDCAPDWSATCLSSSSGRCRCQWRSARSYAGAWQADFSATASGRCTAGGDAYTCASG